MNDGQQHIDLATLAAWMQQQGLGQGAISDVEALGGGTQNILLRFQYGGRGVVLRRPPAHPRPGSNETMRREMRMLAALAGSGVPHPALIAGCPQAEPLGVAFYLMEPVAGFAPGAGLPAWHRSDATVRHRMGLSMVEGIAALAAVDYRAAGLADFGHPQDFLVRQVARWRAQLESYAEFPGWPGPGTLPGVAAVAAWLEAHRPPHFQPGILHGDYHFGNVMFRHDSPELAAIVDWELTTIGDPLLDLGWLLATWPDADGHSPVGSNRVTPWEGFPTAEELVAHYARHSERNLDHMGWYAVLACYKLGLILEGTHARACAGKAPRETGERLHASAVGLFERALAWIH